MAKAQGSEKTLTWDEIKRTVDRYDFGNFTIHKSNKQMHMLTVSFTVKKSSVDEILEQVT